MSRWKVILGVMVIFLAGATTGGVLVRSYYPRVVKRNHVSNPVPISPERRREYISKLDRELELDSTQRVQVEAILQASQGRMKKLWEPVEPQMKEEYRRTRREISEVLTPDQREKMKRFHKEREDRRRGDTNGATTNLVNPLNKGLVDEKKI